APDIVQRPDVHLHPSPCRADRSDVLRRDLAGVRADPSDPRRSSREPLRRARHGPGAAHPAVARVRARSSAAGAVRRLYRPGAAWRPRHLADHARAGAARIPDLVSGDGGARLFRDAVRRRRGPAGRHHRGAEAQHRRRLRGDGRLAHRLLDADILVGAAADPVLFGAARMDAGVGTHRRPVRRPGVDRLHADRYAAGGRCRRLPLGGLAPAAAADRARDDPTGGDRAHDAIVDARGPARRLRAHRPRKGDSVLAGRAGPRAAQRADPGHHRHRAAGGPAAVGRDSHRDDLLLAGCRQLAGPRRAVARLPGRAGRHSADRDDRDQRQPHRRPALRRDQSANKARVMSEVAAIAADVPPAVPGNLREFWQAYTQSRGAIIGLALIIVLVVLAIGANVIAPHSPYEQFRDFTLAPPVWHDGGSTRFLLGTDPVGRDILSRLIHGTRLSLLIGVISVAISLSLGVVLGLAA